MVVVFSALSRNQLNIYFFECYVAQNLWNIVSEIVGVKIGPDFESMARLWLSDTKYIIFFANGVIRNINGLMFALLLFCCPYGKFKMNCAFRVYTGKGWHTSCRDVQAFSGTGAC
jgi:hypothetical protein